MALVYDNLKGMFKEGTSTSEQKNQSGIMTKQLDALSGTGPEGHTLAYITPEEEKLLQKATGKEAIVTAHGIPTYQTDLTMEEMEKNLEKDSELGEEKIKEIKNKALELAKKQNRSNISKAHQEGVLSAQELDEKLTQSTQDSYNIIYNMLLRDEYDRIKKVKEENIFLKAGSLIDRGVKKIKRTVEPFFEKPTGQTEGPTTSGVTEFNPNKDYHLIDYLKEKQMEMQSKEPYFPPQP